MNVDKTMSFSFMRNSLWKLWSILSSLKVAYGLYRRKNSMPSSSVISLSAGKHVREVAWKKEKKGGQLCGLLFNVLKFNVMVAIAQNIGQYIPCWYHYHVLLANTDCVRHSYPFYLFHGTLLTTIQTRRGWKGILGSAD